MCSCKLSDLFDRLHSVMARVRRSPILPVKERQDNISIMRRLRLHGYTRPDNTWELTDKHLSLRLPNAVSCTRRRACLSLVNAPLQAPEARLR